MHLARGAGMGRRGFRGPPSVTAATTAPTALRLPPVAGRRPFLKGGAVHAIMQEHVVQVYTDDQVLVRDVGRYLAAGIDTGGAAVAIATPEHLAAFEAHLGTGRTQGQRWMTATAQEMLPRVLAGGWPDASRFRGEVVPMLDAAQQAGNGRVVVFGELVALLALQGRLDAALEVERLWGDILAQRPFELWCGYLVDAFTQLQGHEAYVQTCRLHTRVRSPRDSGHMASPAVPT